MKERTKKLKKLTVTAAVLAATIAMSATSAMAAWSRNDDGDPIGDTTDEVVIGKSLKTPLNWTPENLAVTFKIDPVGFSTTKEGSSYNAVEKLTYKGETVTLNNTDFKLTDTDDQVKYWGAESGNLVGNIQYVNKAGTTLTGYDALAAVAEEQGSTGAVKFTVTETSCTYSNNEKTEVVTSEASYDLVFWIDYKVVDGTAKYTVSSITDTKTKNDDGTKEDSKVDPTPNSTEVKETTYSDDHKIIPGADNLTYKLSGMLFNNDITKSDEPDTPDVPTEDDNAFSLSKINKGGDANQEFSFTVKLTAPDLAKVDTTKKIKVKVYNADGEVVAKACEFSYGTDNTISLKGDEKAVFGQMYNSTKVEINETGTPSYVPSYTSTYGDSTKIVKNAGDDLSMSGVTTAKTDFVKYTNTYSSITPTGIIMNNLPFFMMILIGAAAVVAGFAFQARRRVADK